MNERMNEKKGRKNKEKKGKKWKNGGKHSVFYEGNNFLFNFQTPNFGETFRVHNNNNNNTLVEWTNQRTL